MEFWQPTVRTCRNPKCSNKFMPTQKRQVCCSRKCVQAKHKNAARTARRKAAIQQFIGVDGEGVGHGKDHKYVLLGVGDKQYENPNGISWQEALTFLWECFVEAPEYTYVGFYLGYDFAQIFKSLPENRARFLWDQDYIDKRRRKSSGGNPTPFPVEIGDWEVDALAFKRIKLRPIGESSWMYINDVGPFFQCSLLKAIDPETTPEPVVTPEEYQAIKTGKEKRDSAQLDDDMRFYNRLENRVLSRLMSQRAEGMKSIGIKLDRAHYYGPGAAADAWLKNIKMPSVESIKENSTFQQKFWAAGLACYFGGWFEIFCHGIIPGVSWEYDINSAYPYIMSRLPCLLHGKWSEGTSQEYPSTGLTMIHASVWGSDPYIGAMNHRKHDGNVLRPQHTGGWYWAHEVEAAFRAGVIDRVKIREWINYEPCECAPPLAGLAELYDFRLSIDKNSPQGIACKLVYNSVYGKMAQSVGSPKYSNPIYASLITAGCRSMILDAIASHPMGTSAVVMVATDGVYFRSRHPTLPCDNKLGNWGETPKQRLTLFKPGVYWDDKARERIRAKKSPKLKSRGVNAAAFAKAIDRVDKEFQSWLDNQAGPNPPFELNDEWPEVKFPVPFTMITIPEALNRGKWYQAGQVIEGKEFTQSASPYIKRHFPYWDKDVVRTEVKHRYLSDRDPSHIPGQLETDSWPYDHGTMGVEFKELEGLDRDGMETHTGYMELLYG
jgi:hypothetical protein